MSSNIVAIVGRPNVGKSTLFNRLTQSRKAIVDDISGTTRDRLYGKVQWCGKEFSIIDTGGWVLNSDDVFESEICKQVKLAIDEADLILFLVDVNTGLTSYDEDVAKLLRRCDKPVFVCANKVDSNELVYSSAEFYRLGLGDPWCISSATGSGTGDLLDAIVEKLPKPAEESVDEDLLHVAIVGRPNAGKSSIVNAFMGEERNIVTDVAGTTRDSINSRYNKFGHDLVLVDTAGIRKKGKVTEDLEYFSVIRSIRSIESADVCVLLIDATRGIESQDMNIFQLIQKNKKGLVVCVNKWDLVEEKSSQTTLFMEKVIRERMAPFTDFPIVFTSATNKQRIHKVLEKVEEVYANRKKKISTSQLNEFFLPLIENYPPPSVKGKYIKIKYVTQLQGTETPAFVFYANLPQYIRDPYKRFLENKLREQWNYEGTPINIFIRQK